MVLPAHVSIPDPAVVVLAGAAGCGKSTVAARHFAADDVLSSDAFRALVAGDAADQSASAAAFSLLRHALDARMARRRFTVVDATNLTRRERRRFVGVARRHDVPAVAVVFDLPLATCRQRAAARTSRPVDAEVVERQHRALRESLAGIDDEGFADVVVIEDEADLDRLTIEVLPSEPGHQERAETVASPDTRPPAVVVDLDGTLASATWREHHLHGSRKDWAGFFAGMGRDAPVQPLVDLVGWVALHADVVLLTGRPADHEPVVRRWLADHGIVHHRLLMRPRDDRRPDTVVKRELYRTHVAPTHDVRLVVDDRPGVIEMWREEGLYVLTAVDPRLDPLPDPGSLPGPSTSAP